MNPFIILEGGDGAGKSSFAKALTLGGGAVLHYGRPTGQPLEDYVARPARWLGAGPLVLDRSFLGSAVWSRLGFHPPVLRPRQWREVCRWYADNGASTWIMVKAWPTLRATVLQRGESDQQAREAVHGQDAFLSLAADNEILYIPVVAVTSGVTMEIQEGLETQWNSQS